MPYYSAGDYYTGDYYQGDNYAAGGLPIFGAIARKLLPVAGRLVGKGLRALTGGKLIGSGGGTTALKRIGGAAIAARLALPSRPNARDVAEEVYAREMRSQGFPGGFRSGRRMNVTNVKALRRAGRRVKGFLKLASRFGALPVNRGKGKLFKKRRAAR